jgi:hypothetical protein
MAAATSESAWAVWNARCGIYFDSITDRRTCAIKDHSDRQGVSWDECRRNGDRVVRVQIEVLEDTKGAVQ